MEEFRAAGVGGVNVYEYERFGKFVSEYIFIARRQTKGFSLKKLAAEADIPSAPLIHMISTGRRVPTVDVAYKLSKAMGFSQHQTDYAALLVAFERAGSSDEKEYYNQKLKIYRTRNDSKLIGLDELSSIEDWYHVAIMEMIDLEDFNDDPAWIASRLRGEVSETEIQQAIERLVRLELLERDKGGSLKRTAKLNTSTDNIPSRSIRIFQSDMLDLAKEQVIVGELEERVVTSVTMTVDPSQVNEMQEDVNMFINQMLSKYHVLNGKEVYNVNTQVFPLTK